MSSAASGRGSRALAHPTSAREHDEAWVLRELVGAHGCHTVILYGSRARGDATPDSDWDVLGIRDAPESLRDARLVDGRYLDAFVTPASEWDRLDAGALRFQGGRVLVQKSSFGTRFLERVDAFAAAGPPPLPADEEAVRRTWPFKTLERVRRGHALPADLEAHYRRSCLLVELIETYFRLRGRWFRGSKEGFAWLAEHDPATFAAFVTAFAPAAPVAALEHVVELVLDTDPR